VSLLGEVLTDVYIPDEAGEHVGGRWVEADRTLTQILLSMSSIASMRRSGTVERIERLTGRSLGGGLEIYSETELKTADENAGTDAYWVRFQSRTYDIVSASYWYDPDGSMSYWECYAALMDPQPTLPE
jgi:hypothetical protein